MQLWALLESDLQGEKVCEPEWYSKGMDCPYGVPFGPPMGYFTWPKEDDRQVLHYLAAFYSVMPFLLAVGFPILFVFTRGLREMLAIIFFWGHKAVMRCLKHMAAQKRPEGSCLHSCGMPSGHSLDGASFLMWFVLEVAFSRSLSLREKVLCIAAVCAVFGPVAWSRLFFKDHSLSQVSVGTGVGILCGIAWYALLQLRAIEWLLKAIVANTFLRPNYPIDPEPEETPWQTMKFAKARA